MSGRVAYSWNSAAQPIPLATSLSFTLLDDAGPAVQRAVTPQNDRAPSHARSLLETAAPPAASTDIWSGGPLAIRLNVESTLIAPLRIAVRSYELSRAENLPAAPSSTQPDLARTPRVPTEPQSRGDESRRGYTRVKPPSDVVKLEDRLAVLLEPPLELLFADQALDFPARPFPFQFEGMAFLYPRNAALLADEMGLGKTMQAITTIRLLIHAQKLRRVLLVCPKPLVSNWRREFAHWAPELPISVIEGNSARRKWLWRRPDAPVKIANYELLRRDEEIVTDPALRYDLVVLDESQRIKNRAGATAHIARAIPRERSWALTGTPVENSSDDLIGIFDFLAPGHLHASMTPRRMGRAAGDYVLRRTKEQVLKDLPPKLFRDADLELLPEQRESYRLAEDDGVLRLTALGESATIQHVLELVLRLKQICNFDRATGASAKLERLMADMAEVAASGQKALVFSQWVETLTVLKQKLHRFRPLEFHGQVPTARRDEVLREFRDDPRRHVLLMSYGAGSVGLNLQFANYVFLFDRWWNPAVEDQAINRVHRIGAAGPVTITRFLTLHTIEERIDQILRDKRELFDTIFSDAAAPRTRLSQEEIFSLFQLRCPTGPIVAKKSGR